MAVTQNSYVGNGSTTTYSFTFPYLKAADVKAQLDATDTTAFTLPTATTLQFNTAPGSGVKIKIYRATDDEALTATFYAGSSIKSEDLNDNFTQNLYTTQEVNDRYLSNLGGTMIGDLTMGEDADITFEGATDDAYETKLTVADPTADRTITLPNATGTVITTGDTGTVTSTMIVDQTIVAGDIANDTITATQIAANAVTSSELADDAVTGVQLAYNAVGSDHIINGSIDLAHMAANSVNSDKIVDGSIVNADVNASAAIAGTKITPSFGSQSIDTTGHINLADNSEYRAGDGDDLIIEHNGTDSLIKADSLKLQKKDGSENLATFTADGAAKLYYDNTAKVETTSAGATISGTLTATLAANSVGASQLSADSVGASELADNSVASANIIDDSIVNADIKSDAAISQGKIALDASLTTLGGMPGSAATILANSSPALAATTAELNLLDGKSIVTTISGTSTDVQLPTAKAVDDRVTALVTDVGGFRPIANETSFPTTNPDPDDNAGTIVSVKALASNLTSNGSGVATIANGAGSGNTVTITGMANSDTIEAGKGILVETTSTLHTYAFHRETLAPADVTAAKTAVDDFNQRYQVAGSEPSNQPDGTALAEGDLFFNTGTDKMMVYDGSDYAEVTSVGDYKLLTLVDAGQTSGLTLGSATTFDLRDGGSAASVTSAGQLIISVNGVLQKPNSGTSQPSEGFCLKDSNTIQFGAAPANGSSIFVTLIGSATTVNVPADSSVTEAKLNVSNGPADDKYLKTNASGVLTWAEAGAGAAGGGTDKIFWENGKTVTTNYTIGTGFGTDCNAGSWGPITINNGVTVTIPNNSNWTII